MAINFPDNPNTGDTFVVDTTTWKFDGVKWIMFANSFVGLQGVQGVQGIQGVDGLTLTVSDTEPLNPIVGQQWYDSGSGKTFTWYDGFWVETGAGGTQGIQGAQGLDGAYAAQGIQGTQGVQGPMAPAYSSNYSQTLGNPVTVPSAGPFPYTVISTSITSGGGPIHVTVSGDANPLTASAWFRAQLYRDSTPIGKLFQAESSASEENTPYSITVIDQPPAGTYAYSLKETTMVSANGWKFGEIDGPVIVAAELTGARGQDGIQGLTGIQGIQGTQGIDGAFAAQGIQGIQGAIGIQGTAGTSDVLGKAIAMSFVFSS